MRAAAGVVALGVFLAVPGCATEASSGEAKSVEGIAVDPRGGGAGGPDAGLIGNLVMDDGCFYLEAQGMRWVLSFPKGDVERAGDGLKFDGETYMPGDEISARGMEVRPDDLEAPSTCKTELVWMVFSENA